ncbi:hypothetical protein N9240_01530 [Akkermansiaceae bacterium]|nr:hypothetical protein [Akkermansiaceae bacterium]
MRSRMLAVGAIVLMLLVGGAGFAFYNSKMNKPEERWIAVPLGSMEMPQREQWVGEWASISEDEALLKRVVADQNLVSAWGSGDEAGAVAELRKRKVVDLDKKGESMRVMVRGLRKERALLNSSSGVLFKEIKGQFIGNHPELRAVLEPGN